MGNINLRTNGLSCLPIVRYDVDLSRGYCAELTAMTSDRAPEGVWDEDPGHPSVRGFLHVAEGSNDCGVVLTHGAGSNCNSSLLIALAESFSAEGVTVLRCDLPFRQLRPVGPPLGTAELDQDGLRRAISVLRKRIGGRLFLGGHSYGGRMASMLAAQDSSIAGGLLLLSYPLHPPRKLQQLRTAHFPKLNIKSLFVHGTRDPFGSVDELQSALRLIPAETKLIVIEGAGHELLTKASREKVVETIAADFQSFLNLSP